MGEYKFDPSMPRKMYTSDIVCLKSCPECGSELEPEMHSYIVLTRQDGNINNYMIENEGGFFCGKCPVVVLHRDLFEEYIGMIQPDAQGLEFNVMGIVDCNAIPEEKKGMPFDDETNPVPLVQFSEIVRERPAPSVDKTRAAKQKIKKLLKKKKKK